MACRKPTCPQLKLMLFQPILGMPDFIRAHSIGPGEDGRKIPLHNMHTIRDLFDGWYLAYPGVRSLEGYKMEEKRPILGNRYTGDRYFIELPKIR